MEYTPSSVKRLNAILERFPRKHVLVLGDLMLDHFVRGRSRRISPEAPVPVVSVEEETHAPGGAGNVCSNLGALGARVSMFGLVGDDLAGSQLLSDLETRGVDVSGILISQSRVTTEKCRIVAEHQQVVRFDRETLRPLSQRTHRALSARLKAAAPGAHALIISDYGKGLITPSLLKSTIRAAHRVGIPVLVDPKVEHFRRYRGVDCITPNLKEAWEGMRQHPNPSADETAIRKLGGRILKALRVRSVLITRGERGMTLFEAPGTVVRHIPTQAKEVYDVTGAGDTVIGVMAMALACRARTHDAAALANMAAGVVVGKLGTATVTPAEIRRALREVGSHQHSCPAPKGARGGRRTS